MKKHQSLITATVSMLLSGSISMALGEPVPSDHAMMHHNLAAPVAGNQMVHEGHGVLKAINLKDNKVQISHEAIANLQWPPMTMWFALNTPLPGQIKVGDKIRFELTHADGMAWEISRVERR